MRHLVFIFLSCSIAQVACSDPGHWKNSLDRELNKAIFELNIAELHKLLKHVPSNYVILDVSDPAGHKPKTVPYFAVEAAVWFEQRALRRERLKSNEWQHTLTYIFFYVFHIPLAITAYQVISYNNWVHNQIHLNERIYRSAIMWWVIKMLDTKCAKEEHERLLEDYFGDFSLSDVYKMVKTVMTQPHISLDKQTISYIKELKQTNPNFGVLKLFN